MTVRIAIPEPLRDRLKRHGHAGMSYSEILNALMDRVEREDFVRDLRRLYSKTPRKDYLELDDV